MPKRNRYRELKKRGLLPVTRQEQRPPDYKTNWQKISEERGREAKEIAANKRIGQTLMGRMCPSRRAIIERFRRENEYDRRNRNEYI